MLGMARQGVATVISVAEAMRDPDRRGELVAGLLEALGHLQSRPYRLPEENPDF